MPNLNIAFSQIAFSLPVYIYHFAKKIQQNLATDEPAVQKNKKLCTLTKCKKKRKLKTKMRSLLNATFEITIRFLHA